MALLSQQRECMKTIIGMLRDEILMKVQAFMKAVDCDWPWSADVRDFVETGDNKGALLWKTEDDDQLAEVEAHFEQKIKASRKALGTKSPNSRAASIARPGGGPRRAPRTATRGPRCTPAAMRNTADPVSTGRLLVRCTS